jgi:hypothetical protein
VLSELDPSSHWLAGQVAGIHLFTLAGGMVIGAAAERSLNGFPGAALDALR